MSDRLLDDRLRLGNWPNIERIAAKTISLLGHCGKHGALRASDLDVPGGRVEVGGREQTVRVLGAANTLAQLREEVDAFFNDVMVMAEDVALRNNRLALLSSLHGMMNRVADISKLAA